MAAAGFTQQVIKPNDKGDWLNQRSEAFSNFIPIQPDKKLNRNSKSIFFVYSRGLETGRDSWIYNYSKIEEEKNITAMINFYNHEREQFAKSDKTVSILDFVNNDSTKISYTSSLFNS